MTVERRQKFKTALINLTLLKGRMTIMGLHIKKILVKNVLTALAYLLMTIYLEQADQRNQSG